LLAADLNLQHVDFTPSGSVEAGSRQNGFSFINSDIVIQKIKNSVMKSKIGMTLNKKYDSMTDDFQNEENNANFDSAQPSSESEGFENFTSTEELIKRVVVPTWFEYLNKKMKYQISKNTTLSRQSTESTPPKDVVLYK